MPPIVDKIVPQYLRSDDGKLPKLRMAFWFKRELCWLVADRLSEDGAVLFRLVRDYNKGRWRPVPSRANRDDLEEIVSD